MKRVLAIASLAIMILPALLLFPVHAQVPAAVNIQGFAFNPTPLNITTGTQVTWTNMDNAPHTATSSTGAPASFNSGSLGNGQSYSFTFTTPGTYSYICTIHPSMTAQVVVSAAAQATATPAATGTPAPPTATSTPAPTATPAPVPDLALFGYPTLGGTQTLAANAGGVITAGSQSATVAANSYTVPVKFDLLVGDNANWQRILNNPAETVIATFAFRVTDTTNGQLLSRGASGALYKLTDPRVNANTSIYLTTAANPSVVTKLAATGNTVEGQTISRTFGSNAVGWFVTVPTAQTPATGDSVLSTNQLLAMMAGGVVFLTLGWFAIRKSRFSSGA